MAEERDTRDGTLRQELDRQLLALLAGGQAHASFDKVVSGLAPELRGRRPEGVPYSAWQLLEHMRIAQRDILDFCTDGNGKGYQHLEWPRQYWPTQPEPPSEATWDQAIAMIHADRESFEALLRSENADLITPFPWGDGQNLLREALLIADHEAYHLGELVLLRRLLGAWAS